MTTKTFSEFFQSVAATMRDWVIDDLALSGESIAITLFKELPVAPGMNSYKPVHYRQYVRITNTFEEKPAYFWTELVGFDLRAKTKPNTWDLSYSELEKLHGTVNKLKGIIR